MLLGWSIKVNNNTEKFSPPNLLKTPDVCRDLFMIEGIHHFVKVRYILHSLQFLSTYTLNHFYSWIVCSVNAETCYENCVFCQEKENWPFWLPRFIMHTFLLFLVFSCNKVSVVRFLQQSFVTFSLQQRMKQIGRAHEGRSAADLPAISHKTRQAENPDVLPATVAPFHRSPSCSPVLTCLHSIAIFSLHTIQALCFSNFFFESHFLLSFSVHTIQALCFSIFFL